MEVLDDGIGIPFNEQEKIFDKFYRLDNDINRKSPGTGLGLPICRALVNLHGGKIWAENGKDRGAIFKFTLPLASSSAVKNRHAVEPGGGAAGLK